jgi:hypothetical protein
MIPEEFHRIGHRVIDWIADYRNRLAELPVLARTEPGEVKAQLPAGPPEQPEEFEAIFRDLEQVLLRGLSHWQHPRFHGHSPSNALLVSVLGGLPQLKARRARTAVAGKPGPHRTGGGRYRLDSAAYQFQEVDIFILEGIFLLRGSFRGYYDLARWVDCTFETALERALRRGQEGLSAAETTKDYDRTYIAAQRIHLTNDDPRQATDLIVGNDPRLGQDSPAGDAALRA